MNKDVKIVNNLWSTSWFLSVVCFGGSGGWCVQLWRPAWPHLCHQTGHRFIYHINLLHGVKHVLWYLQKMSALFLLMFLNQIFSVWKTMIFLLKARFDLIYFFHQMMMMMMNLSLCIPAVATFNCTIKSSVRAVQGSTHITPTSTYQ